MKIVVRSKFNKKTLLLKNKRIGILLLLLSIFITTDYVKITPAKGLILEASPIGTIYIDQPFVQASYTVEIGTPGAVTENFDSASGICPNEIAVGQVSPIEECLVYENDPYFGGATTDLISDPYDEGQHSTYIATHRGPLTVTFPSPKKYIGFWWSAGSFGNQATFLNSDGGVIARLNADAIYLAAGSSYLGHPGELNPEAAPSCAAGARYDCTEPFVYVHAIAAENTDFGGIQFTATGNGFELDNLTTADSAPEPLSRLTSVTQIYSGVTLPQPNEPCSFGSYFAGWYTDPNFNEYYYIGSPGETYFPSQLEIFANCQNSWVYVEYSYPENTFSCPFSGYWNDQYYPIPQTILDARGIADLCETPLIKPGYQLIGWYSVVDGVSKNYVFGDSVDSENLILYPLWEELNSNLIAPDVVLVDPRVNFVNFPEISIDGAANILLCVQQSNSAGEIENSPTLNFDVSTKGSSDASGVGTTPIDGDFTSTLLLRHERQNVLDTLNSAGGLRVFLSSGSFTTSKYVRVRTIPVASSTTEVTSATCDGATSSASKTVEIRPLGLTNTLRKGTIQLK
jgi:hypothetical protein